MSLDQHKPARLQRDVGCPMPLAYVFLGERFGKWPEECKERPADRAAYYNAVLSAEAEARALKAVRTGHGGTEAAAKCAVAREEHHHLREEKAAFELSVENDPPQGTPLLLARSRLHQRLCRTRRWSNRSRVGPGRLRSL
jgi:hypothetical protein